MLGIIRKGIRDESGEWRGTQLQKDGLPNSLGILLAPAMFLQWAKRAEPSGR
jgi:hypothetical protein